MSSDALVAVTVEGTIVCRDDLTVREACERVVQSNLRAVGVKEGCAVAVGMARLIDNIMKDRALLALYTEHVEKCRTTNQLALTPDEWMESKGFAWNVTVEKHPLDDVKRAFPR